MKTRSFLLAAALAAAPLSVATTVPAGAAVATARPAAAPTLASHPDRLRPTATGQLAAAPLGAARVIASNSTLRRTGRGTPYKQAAFFVVLSALVGTACGVGRNLAGRRRG